MVSHSSNTENTPPAERGRVPYREDREADAASPRMRGGGGERCRPSGQLVNRTESEVEHLGDGASGFTGELQRVGIVRFLG